MNWLEVEERIETYKKLMHALKPGGYFMVSETAWLPSYIMKIIDIASKRDGQCVQRKQHFQTISQNEELVSGLGYEVVEAEQFRHVITFPTLDALMTWITATWHGSFDASSIYESFRHEVDNMAVPTTDVGCQFVICVNYMVFRKPYN